jgi:hypothetical protein
MMPLQLIIPFFGINNTNEHEHNVLGNSMSLVLLLQDLNPFLSPIQEFFLKRCEKCRKTKCFERKFLKNYIYCLKCYREEVV